MTEDEAKTKWCPACGIARVISLLTTATLAQSYKPRDQRAIMEAGVDTTKGEQKCIASGCMMWCWNGHETTGGGHCGLAMKP